MHAALSYLAALPPQTVVYDGHEYTRGSLAFAKSVDPENAALARLEKLVKDGEIGEDEGKRAEKELDALTKKAPEQIDTAAKNKEAELLKV